MRKTAVITVVLLAGALALAAVDPPKAVQLPQPKPLPLYRFDVQAIHAVETTPCKVVYQVQYYISSTYPKACFIGAHVPDRAHANTGFSYSPAGRLPNGVPKGQRNFADNVTFYIRTNSRVAFEGHSIEVEIYDADGTVKGSKTFTWNQEWTRFQVQGIRREVTRSDYVKCQVQYFIDPTYGLPCFVSAYIPDSAHQSSYFHYNPAGRLPNGVPKGQVRFSDNVWFEAFYGGGTAFTTSTIEVVIYESGITRDSALINWGQTWMPTLH